LLCPYNGGNLQNNGCIITSYIEAVAAIGKEEAKIIAMNFAKQNNIKWDEAISTIFSASCDPEFSPNFKTKQNKPSALIEKWVQRYSSALNNKASSKLLVEPKTKHDDAMDFLISKYLGDVDIADVILGHRLYMSSEGMSGNLLEEYISCQLYNLGWYCAWGSTVRSVDFVSVSGEKLQIKSRNTSENSSSNKIRADRDIKHWWRFNAHTGNTNWVALQEIVGTDCVNEQGFRAFLSKMPG